MKKIVLLFGLILAFNISYAQEEKTLDQLATEKAALDAQIAELNGQVGALQGQAKSLSEQMTVLKGWRTGSFGTLGFNQSTFNNWIKGANPNSTSSTILAALNGFANKKTPKYFWRNSGVVNLGWQKLDTNTGADGGEKQSFEKIADVLKITSLYGRNINPKLAMSALGEYNTAILSNFNNPGILDIGVGFTWLPVENMVVVIHPINYHWVLGDNPNFSSALGAKVVVDYNRTFPGGVTWRTNLTGFTPYSSQTPTLREYTWTNGFSFSAWKGIGVGVEFALRNAEVEYDGTQSYLVFGLSYAL